MMLVIYQLGEILFKIFMENEKHFYPTPESKEIEPKSYGVHFDNNHFGDTERPKGTSTHDLVGELNGWWKRICTEQGVNPEDKSLKQVDYYLMELGKNALDYTGGGEIKVIFESNKITVVVSDQGQGFEDPNDDILYGSPGHGLSEVKRYADEFIIETNGAKFTKAPKKKKLVRSEETDIQQGSKITFIKNFE